MLTNLLKFTFEKKLSHLGFSYQCNTDDFYTLSPNTDLARHLQVQLICSDPVNEIQDCSRNGNVIQAIGLFRFKLSVKKREPDLFIFIFQNTKRHQSEYIIIPSDELKHRLIKGNWIPPENHIYKKVFWLIPDNCLYETTNISIEAEWYFLSKGVNGRMADRTEWNYTSFLNNWEVLRKSKS